MNNLCFYVLEISKIEDSVNQNKLSISEVQALWTLIDINQKGHLDLNDIYELAGKVSEEQLFAIFKWLDAKRTGQITLSSLQESLGDRQSTTKNHQKEYLFPKFYKIIDAVKDRPKLIDEIKIKFHFSQEYLRSVYQSVSNLIQSKYINQGEFITVFKSQFIKNQLNWNESIENLLKSILPTGTVSESKFIQSFCCKISQRQVQEECLLIDNPVSSIPIYKEKYAKKAVESEPKQVFHVNRLQEQRQATIPTRTPTYNNFVANENLTSVPPQVKPRVEASPIRQISSVENGINEVLNSIKERRQRLKEDSKERKQLIDNVLQRKRQLCGLNQVHKTAQVSPAANGQIPYDFRHSTHSQDKSVKTYLNPQAKYINIDDTVKEDLIYRPETPIYRPEQLSTHEYTFVPTTQYRSVGQTPNYISRSNSQAKLQRDGRTIILNPYSSKDQVLRSSYHKNFDINEILKKYATINRETPKNSNVPITEIPSFKQPASLLSKSKSGILENQQNIFDPNQFRNDRYHVKQTYLSNSKSRNNSQNNSLSILTGNGCYKQNVMKRAQEQATKKIEQIQRKARMKVLEKKGAATRFGKQQKQWGKLIKNNIRHNS